MGAIVFFQLSVAIYPFI